MVLFIFFTHDRFSFFHLSFTMTKWKRQNLPLYLYLFICSSLHFYAFIFIRLYLFIHLFLILALLWFHIRQHPAALSCRSLRQLTFCWQCASIRLTTLNLVFHHRQMQWNLFPPPESPPELALCFQLPVKTHALSETLHVCTFGVSLRSPHLAGLGLCWAFQM